MELSSSYDAVAAEYGVRISGELAGKPLDRWLLGRVVELAEGGPVVDAGCGPGHVTELLAGLGADVTGVDLSAGMVAEAQRRHPTLTFTQGDLRHLPTPGDADGWAAVVAMYSLIHVETRALPAVLEAIRTVVRPGGHLLVAVHAGTERRHLDEWMDQSVDLDFVFHPPEAVRSAVVSAGFDVVEHLVRAPYAGVEAETDRVYVLAQAA